MADADFSVKAIISAQTSQFEKGIKNAQSSINSMSKSIEGVQKLLKSAFSVVGIGMSIKAVTDFGKTCVQSANQAQKAFNILDNTVKATGADAWTSTKQLEASSKELSDSTNYSVTEIQKAQSVLLGFTNITGEAFDGASEAVLDMATVMGMDLTSAVQTIGKALDDPITGLDSLRRQGFKFTDEQKAELTQLVKNGKQLEAQKIILDTLATSYGGAAKAGQDSFAKQRHAMENFTDTLGGKLIPVFRVFAENSAKTLNHLTDLISKMDFTPIVNVVSNLSRIFSSAFNTISNYLKDVKNEVTDFISRFNFQPIISIIDTLAGVFITVFGKIKSSLKESSNTFNNVKESLIEFSHSETFQKIADTINLIIDALVFLWEEVERVVGEIRTFVVGKVINIWNKIKELFQKSQNALAESTGDIKSWGDYFYKIFNNCFRVVQDLIHGVSALLKGDWEVAWEYAKLVVLRLADSVATSLETIKTTFKDKMKTMITIASTAMGVVGGPMGKALQLALKGIEAITTDPLGLVENAGNKIEEMISQTETRIEELTKKPADTALSDLNGVSDAFAGFTSNALGNIQDLTEGAQNSSEKQKHHFQSTASTGEKTYKKFSEWDIKLLQQRLEDLDEWSDEYSRINVELIEQERKKALEADTTGAETEKINKFYNKKIEKEHERSEDAKRNHVKETVAKVAQFMKNMAKNVINVFKKIISSVKKIVSAAFNILKKLVDINIDNMLDAMLEFEDGILTFFVETMPRLPSFIASAIESIKVLFATLKNYIKAETISDILFNMLTQLSEALPGLMSDLLGMVEELINGVIDGLVRWLDADGIQTILNLILKIQSTINNIITNNLDKIVDMLANHIDDFANFFAEFMTNTNKTLPKIFESILKLVMSLIEMIGKIFQNKEFINSFIEAIKNIITLAIEYIPKLMPVIVDAIVAIIQAIVPELPKLILFIVKAINEAIPKVLSSIVSGLATIISEIFKAIFTPEFWQDVLSGLWEGIKGAFSSIGDVGEAVGSAVGGHNVTGSGWGDIGLAVATGGISTLGKLFGWWATGTNAVPRGLSIVGEAGPELVNFRGGEQILNSHNTQKALENMGGNTNNFNVTFNNMQDTSAYAMIQQLKQYNREMAINGII